MKMVSGMGRAATLLWLAGAGVALGGAGCANTLNGARQDAATDTQKVSTAADQAAAKTAAEAHKVGVEVKAVPENAAAAATVTPEVKTAIVRDPVLNDPRNVVNVSSANRVVHLTGHVQDASMQQRATEDAQVVLAKRHPDFTVSNELTVSGGKP